MSKQTITVIPGDGIGPEITKATLRVLDAVGADLEYDMQLAGLTAIEAGKELIPEQTLDSIRANSIALKGPLTTPIGKGFTSLNVMLRKEFDLYANVRPAVTRDGIESRYQDIDLITVRENTEGMYSQEKQTLSEDGERAESVSVITRVGAERVLRFAFDMAKRQGRKKIAVVHKANILKATSGLFLDVSRDIREEYDELETTELSVDNACMQLVVRPEQFDVIVTTNLFGDIISDLCAGLVGGLGMAPGANIGDDAAIFEAVHGSAPDIAGKGIANPFALTLAATMMLDQLDQPEAAQRIRSAINNVIKEKDRLTGDLGGTSGTQEIADAVIERL
ncbi:MAG: isocitrate dehydrogenase [Acidiferrobacterales bacterium]|nr:isocitrate dehydrogenase [Acidiferrobacterales bacterium]